MTDMWTWVESVYSVHKDMRSHTSRKFQWVSVHYTVVIKKI